MNHINANGPPQKIADSIYELVSIDHEKGNWNDINFIERKIFSNYLNGFQNTIFEPEIDFTNHYLDIRRSESDPKWQFNSYLKLIRVDLPNKVLRTEEITVEHIVSVSGYIIHYQLPVSYCDKIKEIWFKPDYFAHYGTRENHYNFNFFKKLEYIVISLKHMLEQISIKEPNLNMSELVSLIDSYDIRYMINKSHLEFELQIP